MNLHDTLTLTHNTPTLLSYDEGQKEPVACSYLAVTDTTYLTYVLYTTCDFTYIKQVLFEFVTQEAIR